MRNLNRIRSNGSEQMEARELLCGSNAAFASYAQPTDTGSPATGFGGSKGEFGGSKGGFGGSKGSFNGGGSTSGESETDSSSSSSTYDASSSSEADSSSSDYCTGFSEGFSTGYQTGFADGVSFATSFNEGADDSQTPPPELPEECPTPAPEPTPPTPPVDECPPTPPAPPAPPATPAPPAPPTPGPSSDFSSGFFNGHQYQLLKNKGTKMTYKNYDLPGGSRTVDYNTITGTWKTHSPIAFDLNGTGKIETTGVSTARTRVGNDPVGSTVCFDIDGNGTKENIEWMAGNADGLLVDNRDGNAAGDMNGNRLFGNTGGFTNGYDKLASLDKNRDGKLTGRETRGLQVWVDNGNAQVDAGELKSLSEFKINQISVRSHNVTNSRGETLVQSTAGQGSNQVMSEDVWFAQA